MDCRQSVFTGSLGSSTEYNVNPALKQETLDVISALEARYAVWKSQAADTEVNNIMDDTHSLVIEYIKGLLGIDHILQ